MSNYPSGMTQADHDRAMDDLGDCVEDEIEIPCECKRCDRCEGSGVENWYLGDEFNSNGQMTCGTCEGAGVITEDCAVHHA